MQLTFGSVKSLIVLKMFDCDDRIYGALKEHETD